MADADPKLDGLRASLVEGRPRQYGDSEEEGLLAFKAHKPLAGAILRAGLLSKTSSYGEGDAFRAFIESYHPSGRNGAKEAAVLWKDWRTSMLKKDTPGPLVGLTHGRKPGHWTWSSGRLIIDLDYMWDDFESGVDRFVDSLRVDRARRRVVLDRFGKQEWTVVKTPIPASFTTTAAQSITANSVTASYSSSATVLDLGNGQETGRGAGRPKAAGSKKRKPRKKRKRR